MASKSGQVFVKRFWAFLKNRECSVPTFKLMEVEIAKTELSQVTSKEKKRQVVL